MRTPFRYPGAKNRLLPVLMERLSPHLSCPGVTFSDLFVGGGSVLIKVAEEFPEIKLRANDFDTLMSSFWALVAEGNAEKDETFHTLIDVPVTAERFWALRGTEPCGQVESAYYALFFNRTCFSGILKASPIGGKKQESKWKVDCRYNADKLHKSYDDLVKLLRGRLTVSARPIADALRKETWLPSDVLYLDPPYYVQGPALYTEGMDTAQHNEMAHLLQTCKAQWVLSYDGAPEVRSLYLWANVSEVPARYCIKGKKKGWEEKVELIISSGKGVAPDPE
jgi:DNA adenine methylase